MLKWFNKKRKDNKGFTLVELVIVVAILAILVGVLAPQYTKYVEKSRKAADAANLDNLVKAVQVAAVDADYADIIPATGDAVYTITIAPSDTNTTLAVSGAATDDMKTSLTNALNEFAGNNWQSTSLKSKAWKTTGTTSANAITATCTINDKGAVSVVYNPEDVKNASDAN